MDGMIIDLAHLFWQDLNLKWKRNMAKYEVKSKLTKPGFPYKQKGYAKANTEANVAEKKKYPKGYNRMKKVDASMPKGEFAATISKRGKVKVSAKVPAKLRGEAVYHDREELKKLKK